MEKEKIEFKKSLEGLSQQQRLEKINFNSLAWYAPKHDGIYGYKFGDEWYEDIVAWLNTGEQVWVDKDKEKTTKRLHGCIGARGWDVIARWYYESKIISWIFRESHVFHVLSD
jgi:hypothetical protein